MWDAQNLVWIHSKVNNKWIQIQKEDKKKGKKGEKNKKEILVDVAQKHKLFFSSDKKLSFRIRISR